MSRDEPSDVGHFCFAVFVLRVGDIECSESCKYSKDGYCDDGGFGSDYDVCVSGTDCEVGGFHLRTNFQKKIVILVSELSPSHSTFSFFFKHPIL